MSLIEELISKQYFIVNLETIDIADVMIDGWEDDGDEEEGEGIYSEDNESNYFQSLLEENNISLEKINGAYFDMWYDSALRSLFVEINGTNYKLSILDYLDYPDYKTLTSYFSQRVHIKLTEPSMQVGGIVDKNYGFKFKVII